MKKILLSLVAATTLATPAFAQSYAVDNGVVTSTPGPVVDNVLARDIGAVKLTAYWGNSSEEMLFGNNGSGWGFFGTGLSLSVNGNADTFFAPWSLNNNVNGLTRLLFNAHGTTTVFDRALGFLGLAEGTPGSNIGNDADAYRCGGFLNLVCVDRWNTLVTYRDAVGLAPAEPQGDLFKQMDIEFRSRGGVASGRDVDAGFLFDTDFAPTTTTPEPSTYALMAAGLAVMSAVARRRRRNA